MVKTRRYLFIKDVKYNAHTAILGAGITGLCAGLRLNKNKQSIQIFESTDQVGGALKSTQKEGYLAEHGPNSLLIKDLRVANLLKNINLLAELAHDEAKNRYIVQDGTLHAMPSSPWGMIRTPLFSALGKLRFALEPFIGRYKGHRQGLGEESFANFVRRRLGPDMLASAAGPFVSGIYAGDPENLSVRHAFPRLWNLENNYGSFILGAIALQLGWGKGAKNPHRLSPAQMVSFPSGMSSLPQAIAQKLPKDAITLNSQITEIKRNDSSWELQWTDAAGEAHQGRYQNLIISTPHHRLSSLPLPQEVLDALKPVSQLASPPVTSLVLGFKREDVPHPLDGFGMLIKRTENSPLLGVLFSSSMFDGRAPDGHVTITCMMGGTINPAFANNSDAVVLKELNRLLGITAPPTFKHRTAWQHAIPQYDLEYQHVIDAIENCEQSQPGLHFAGNYRGGISVGDCIVNGLELGKSLANAKKAP